MAFSITDEHVQRAFNTLHQNEHAKARAAYEFAEKHLKVVLSKALLAAEGKTVGEREAQAQASDAYMKALNDFHMITELYNTARDKRQAAVAVIDGWRTQSSDARALMRIG